MTAERSDLTSGIAARTMRITSTGSFSMVTHRSRFVRGILKVWSKTLCLFFDLQKKRQGCSNISWSLDASATSSFQRTGRQAGRQAGRHQSQAAMTKILPVGVGPRSCSPSARQDSSCRMRDNGLSCGASILHRQYQMKKCCRLTGVGAGARGCLEGSKR
jgi:hypothetical protein